MKGFALSRAVVLALALTGGVQLLPGPAQAASSLFTLAQQGCNPKTQKCCVNPDGVPVPPGTKVGPYTCLPNGTWG